MQAIIEKYVYCEKSSNCDKDKDGIGGIEMICEKIGSPLEISHHEALGMLDQLLLVVGISKIDCTVFPGHQPQEANLLQRFIFIKYMKFWD